MTEKKQNKRPKKKPRKKEESIRQILESNPALRDIVHLLPRQRVAVSSYQTNI